MDVKIRDSMIRQVEKIRKINELPINHSLNSLIKNTLCPFAKLGEFRYGEEVLGTGFFHSELGACDILESFLNSELVNSVDILFLCTKSKHKDVESLTSFFKKLSQRLYLELNQNDIEFNGNSPKFMLKNVPFFITVHSPIYPETHSRNSFGDDTILGFQPYKSFERFNVQEKHQIRVRNRFLKNGKPYTPSATIDSDNELEKFIKPIQLQDPVIRWWL